MTEIMLTAKQVKAIASLDAGVTIELTNLGSGNTVAVLVHGTKRQYLIDRTGKAVLLAESGMQAVDLTH